MPNLGGPNRALLLSVVNSRLLHASSTWAERVKRHTICRNLMIRAQKLAALRITRAYRTVCAGAALFLAGTPPGDLLALERKRVRSKIDVPAKHQNGNPGRRVRETSG